MVEGPLDQSINSETLAYWESGGKLDRRGFEKAQDVLSGQDHREGSSANKYFLSQAENMSAISKLPITPEQKYLYAVLRERSSLSDQCLMAEVVRLTDKGNLNSFMLAYPYIFGKMK